MKKCEIDLGAVSRDLDFAELEKRVLASLEDEAIFDIHTLRAVELFGIEPDQVSRKQREVAKILYYKAMYSGGRGYENWIPDFPRSWFSRLISQIYTRIRSFSSKWL